MSLVSDNRPRIGLVLSGGGSRGAYEVGVLKFIRERLGDSLGYHVPFDIIAGTSVGALNAAFLASTADDPDTQLQSLINAWCGLRMEELLALGTMDIMRAIRSLLRSDPPPPKPGSFSYGGLLDTTGLERFVVRNIPWRNIRRNLKRRHLHALSVSTTHVGTGHTVVFVDSADPVPASWSKNPFIRHRGSRIGPRHVLASAAIPMLFPAVNIGGQFYTDGGLRQNTPMSPAIRLGADRILLISLRHVSDSEEQQQQHIKEREHAYPRPLFLMGKALNALLLDATEYDLDRMNRLNSVLDVGEQCFGPEFTDIINRKFMELRGAPIRRIEAVHIRPSEDIGMMASEFVKRGRASVQGRVARNLLARLAERESNHENDLLSYFLFDGVYAAELIELGYQDARRQEQQLLSFFGDPSSPA